MKPHIAALLLATSACGRLTHAADFKFPTQTLSLPEGFTIELVAGPGLVDRPIMADFDEQGNLYVADSSGSNDKVDKQVMDRPHRIVRLSDTNGDGIYDKQTVYADKMMFPEGILWHEGSVYCGAPPSIWKLTDTNGDGVADQRTEWFQAKTLTGCANDLHGPYLAPDGFIYWCKGAFAEQTHLLTSGKTITDKAAHIFRCRPDGSDFDSVMTGGMDNPVEATFNAAGDVFFTTTFFTNPAGGNRDALVHAVYGGVYPKIHDVLEGLIRTGDLMPAMTHFGAAAPSGLMTYQSDAFGADYKGNLFSSQFNMRRVQRHVLEPLGSSFRTKDIDFVTSDNPDFHATDILEDADGSLLLVDTGGWYKICCPTAQLAKPEILGAIYRIRSKAAKPATDACGLKLAWDQMSDSEMARLLDDKRPFVRKRAMQTLALHGDKAVGALGATLAKSKSPEARWNAVWTLTRIQGNAARAEVRKALNDVEATVRKAALNSAGLLRDKAAAKIISNLLVSASDPHEQRAAASALGRLGDQQAVAALLRAAGSEHDRNLEHAIIYALYELADEPSMRAALKSEQPYTKRAALIALDQLKKLSVSAVAPLLLSENSTLKETAIWIAGFHPEWGSEVSAAYATLLKRVPKNSEEKSSIKAQFASVARNSAVQELTRDLLASDTTPRETKLLILESLALAPGRSLPPVWVPGFQKVLSTGDEKLASAAVAVLRRFPQDKKSEADFLQLRPALIAIAREQKSGAGLRVDALAALGDSVQTLEAPLYAFAKEQLQHGSSPLTRLTAAQVLSRAALTEDQLTDLAETVRGAGALELPRLLTAFERSRSEQVGVHLVEALNNSKGLSSLRFADLKGRLGKYPSVVQVKLDALAPKLDADLEKQKAHLGDLETALKSGDKLRGSQIFNSQKAACVTCHAVGYLGGRVGPDLTRIGSVRTERDLLESIVYPSASFVRSYEPMKVSTRDGELYTGIIREGSDGVVVVSGPGAETMVAKGNIQEISPGSLSVMPQGLDEQLSKNELADLIAFLKSLR